MVRVTLRFASVAALLAACGFQPGLAGGVDGSFEGGDGGSGTHDAGADSDSGVVLSGRCSSPGAFRDDFSIALATNFTGHWIVGANATVSGGTFSVTPLSATAFAGILAKHAIDITGANVSVEVPAMIANANATAGLFLYSGDLVHYLAIYQQQGMLVAEYNLGAGPQRTKIAYDGTLQRFWRIAEANGQITFQYSADNATWTTFGPATTTPVFATELQIVLGGLSYDNQTHGTAQFDNLNTSAEPAAWCKANTFVDRFARTAIGFDWTRRLNPTNGNGCTPTVTTGAHFDQASNTNAGRCWLSTQKAFDLKDSSAMIDVVPAASPPAGWSVFLRAVNDDLDAFYIQFEAQGQICSQVKSNAAVCVPYVAGSTFYRLREANSTLFFETSPDATAWSVVSQVVTPFSLASTHFEIGTATTNSIGAAQPLTVSLFNATP